MNPFQANEYVNMDQLRAQANFDALVAMGMAKEVEDALHQLIIKAQLAMAGNA